MSSIERDSLSRRHEERNTRPVFRCGEQEPGLELRHIDRGLGGFEWILLLVAEIVREHRGGKQRRCECVKDLVAVFAATDSGHCSRSGQSDIALRGPIETKQ